MAGDKSVDVQGFSARLLRLFSWGIILLIIGLTIAIRIRLLEVPLERDEGEYAYAGQLILQGILPYVGVYNMKMPGIYGIYALILAIFGQTPTGIHLGLLTTNIATIVLLFFLTKRLFNSTTAIIASANFAVLSLSPTVQGLFANAEHFVILPTLGGMWLLLRATDTGQMKHYIYSGLLFGLAFIVKQHAAAFIIFAFLYLFYHQWAQRPFSWLRLGLKSIAFFTAVVLPFGLLCLIFFLAAVFDKFWFWTFTYAREYISLVDPLTAFNILRRRIPQIINPMLSLWVLAGIGLVILARDRRIRPQGLFVTGFFAFSFLAVCPGFYFRPHYFLFLLPAIALLAAIGVSSLANRLRSKGRISILLAAAALLFCIYQQQIFLFQLSPTMVSRLTYGANPFPESIEIAKYIKGHTSQNDLIAVFGSEPQIYFYSDRHSATRYMYLYPLLERQRYALKMQQDMMAEIEQARPKYLVYDNIIYTAWLRIRSEDLIFDWVRDFCHKYYERVGIVEILNARQTRYYWDEESVGYHPRSRYWLSIHRRL